MKRLHLRVAYALLWVLTTGLFILTLDHYRQIAVDSGQSLAIARFMLVFGPAFLALYILTTFLLEIRLETITIRHFKDFLYSRRVPIGLMLFCMILFVLLAFHGVSFRR